MGCNNHVGILDDNGKLTEKAKNDFIEEVQDIIKYGTKGIPPERQPAFSAGIEVPPNTNPEAIPDLKNETVFSAFHKNWLGRYEKIANDLNVSSNFSLLPAIADPIALAGSAFNVELPALDFPSGFIPYFSGLLPQKLLLDLVDAGKTEFLKPDGLIKLVDTLIKAKTPPIPPIPVPPIIVPPPLPAGLVPPPLALPELPEANIPDVNATGLPQVSLQLPNPSLPINAEIPLPPQAVLSTLATKEFAAFANVPKLLLQIIGKIPSLITKFGNVPKLMEEICKLVIESGILGDIKQTSSIELAASIVLSRKISEMLLTAGMSSTIGSAPGSATTGVTQVTSGPNPDRRYKSKTKKEPTKAPELTPAQKAKQRAIGLAGSSYGDPAERSRYVGGLFIIESVLGKYDPGTINIYGNYVQAGDALSDQEIADIQTISKLPKEKKERLKSTPVKSLQGFSDIVAHDAPELSSCGLFVRSCYAAAGCNNYFFLSLYAAGTAIQVLENIGLMRNYRWVSENGKPGIMDDYKNPDKQFDELRKLIDRIAGENSSDNIADFAYSWSLKLKEDQPGGVTSTYPILERYLKPPEERAFIFGIELAQLAKNKSFPALEAGDAILITKTSDDALRSPLKNGEHILLVTKDRPAGFDYTIDEKNPKNNLLLTNAIYAVEGGALDDENTEPGTVGLVYKSRVDLETLLNASGPDIFKMIPEKYRTGGQYDASVTPEGKTAFLQEFDQKKSITFNLTTDIPRPSAILEATYDLGVTQTGGAGDNTSGAGLFLGTSKISRTNELKNKSMVEKEGQSIGIKPLERRIIGIFKTNNYCKKIENVGDLATDAMYIMDTTPVNDVRRYFDGGVLDIYGYYMFKDLIKANLGRKALRDKEGKIVTDSKGNPVLAPP
jgi:hypothetical protein